MQEVGEKRKRHLAMKGLFGNRQLGMLMSKVQSAMISPGNELEEILASHIKNTKGISIQKINKENGVFKGIKDGHDIIIDCVIEKKGNSP